MLYVHGRKPRQNRRDSAVTPRLDVFRFHQRAVKADWGGRSGEYRRVPRFNGLTVPARDAHFNLGDVLTMIRGLP
jgi:hypothetical protein